MTSHQRAEFVRQSFRDSAALHRELAGGFADDVDAVVDRAAEIFDEMIPSMAYVDDRDHPMASSLFFGSGVLALYLALSDRAVDAHAFGRTLLKVVAKAPNSDSDGPGFEAMVESADASQAGAAPGEFVYEIFRGDREKFSWGMNITSCGICHLYSKHDAMDLVPYMCALDDIESDRWDQGLRRTGTIALGAEQCDFRFKRSGEALSLAEQYPEQLRNV